MTKGRPWNVDEEKRLGELLKSGVCVYGVGKVMGKTFEGVQNKVRRLSLVEEGAVDFVPSSPSSTTLLDVGLDAGKALSERIIRLCVLG